MAGYTPIDPAKMAPKPAAAATGTTAKAVSGYVPIGSGGPKPSAPKTAGTSIPAGPNGSQNALSVPYDTSHLFKDFAASMSNNFVTPSVSMRGKDISALETRTPTVSAQVKGQNATISEAPKRGLLETAVQKVKDFGRNAFTSDSDENRTASSIVSNAIENRRLTDIGKSLGLDRKFPVDASGTYDKRSAGLRQDRQIADYVRNNYDAIRANVEKPENLPIHPDMLSPKFDEINRDIRKYAQQEGIPLGSPKLAEVAPKLVIGLGLVSAAPELATLRGVMTLGSFEALGRIAQKLTGYSSLSDYAADRYGLNESTKSVLEAVEMVGEGGALESAFSKSPALAEKLLKRTFEEYLPGKTVEFSPAQIRDIFQTGTRMGPEEVSLWKSLGRTKEQIRDDIAHGIRINVAPEKLVTIADRPYWAKIKGAFGLSSKPETVSMSSVAKAAENVTGKAIEAPKAERDPLGKVTSSLMDETRKNVELHGGEATANALVTNLGLDTASADRIVRTALTPSTADDAKLIAEGLFGKADEGIREVPAGDVVSGLEPNIESAVNIRNPDVAKMVEDIGKGDVIPPVPVFVNRDGRYQLNKDGSRRLIAHRIANRDIRIRIEKETSDTAHSKQVSERKRAESERPAVAGGTETDVSRISSSVGNSLEADRSGIREKSLRYYLDNPDEISKSPVRLREADGKVVIEDGRHRLEAARELGMKTIRTVDTTREYPPVEGGKGSDSRMVSHLVSPKRESEAEVRGTGETKTRGLALGVEAKAVEKKLATSLEGLPEYRTVNMKEQARLASDIVEGDYELAKRIAMGHELPPNGVIPEALFIAVENRAIADGDVGTLRALATSSSLTTEATTMGQRIRTLAERDPHSPVRAIREISEARANVAKKRSKTVERAKKAEVDRMKKEMARTAPSKQTWAEFVESITC